MLAMEPGMRRTNSPPRVPGMPVVGLLGWSVGMRLFSVGNCLLVLLDDEVRVLESVAGEARDDACVLRNFARGAQLSYSGKGCGRGRLTADAVAADRGLGLGDLFVGDINDLAACVAHAAQRLLPRARVADADRGRDGLRFYRRQFVGLIAPELGEGI